MSLAQHVTQVEGFDYEGPANPSLCNPQDVFETDKDQGVIHLGDSPPLGLCQSPVPFGHRSPYLQAIDNKSEWRHMTFAAIPEIEEDEPHIPQYKVSELKRFFQVATAIVFCWISSGIVFGFAALKPVLVAEGVYAEYCETSKSGHHHHQTTPCAEQDIRLNLFFTAASITANISSLLAGSMLDRYGRRICWLIACVALAAGSALMGSSFAVAEFDGYMLANIFLSFGGTFLFVPSFQLANAFPKYSGLIVALVTGAFDASAAVYLFYRMAYEATGGAFSVENFFFCYLIVPVIIFVAELTYMPPHAYQTYPELEQRIVRAQDITKDIHESDEDMSSDESVARVRRARADKRLAKLDRIESIAGDAEQREERVKINEEVQEASGVWGVLHGVPLHRQLLSPWFIFILMLTVFQMLRMNFFIATIRNQYQFMLGSSRDAQAVNHFFDAALPLGGVLSTPFIGILLNKFSVPTNFGILTFLVAAIGICNCLPCLWAGYSTVVLFAIFRPLYYSAISDYATKVFGFASFGRIYGTLICLSGFFSLTQSTVDKLMHGPLHGDPTLINMTMGIMGSAIGIALTVFIWVKGRNFRHLKEEMESDQERQLLLGAEAIGYGTKN